MATPGFVITNAGLDAALLASAQGFSVVITEFRLGNAYGYTPTKEDTKLKGNILYSSAPSSYNKKGNNTILITCTVPQAAGPFQFGEIGLYLQDGTLFAVSAWNELITKYSYLETEISSSIKFYCYLTIDQGVENIKVDFGENPSSVKEIYDVNSWRELGTPISFEEDAPEVIVHETSPMGDSILLTKTSDNKWSVASTYSPAFTGLTIVNSTQSYVEVETGTPGLFPSIYNASSISGHYMMGFPDSTFEAFGSTQFIPSSNRLRLNYKTPLDVPKELFSNCTLYSANTFNKVISIANISGGIHWNDIQDKPTTFEGYGLTLPRNSEIGCVSCVPSNNIPAGKMISMGQELSRTEFAPLYAVVGAGYGGNGSTTFRLPDLRGLFLRFWDGGRGIDVGRSIGSYQDDGAPNVKGSGLYAENYTAGDFQVQCTGCVYVDVDRGKGFIGSNKTDRDNYVQAIDASRNSPVYGRSPNELRVKNISLVGVITYA